MVIEHIAGTVNDNFRQETEKSLGYLPKDIPLLGISFDAAIKFGNGLITFVAITNDSPESKLLKAGDRVRCAIEPAGPGYGSKLLSVHRL